jgi:hypothetical protein
VLSEGKEGERQSGLRATYSRWGALIDAGSNGIDGGARVTGNGRRREERPEIEDDWQVGPTRQRGGGPQQRTVSGLK